MHLVVALVQDFNLYVFYLMHQNREKKSEPIYDPSCCVFTPI